MHISHKTSLSLLPSFSPSRLPPSLFLSPLLFFFYFKAPATFPLDWLMDHSFSRKFLLFGQHSVGGKPFFTLLCLWRRDFPNLGSPPALPLILSQLGVKTQAAHLHLLPLSPFTQPPGGRGVLGPTPGVPGLPSPGWTLSLVRMCGFEN